MALLEKLYKIQTELKAPKGQYNSFGKYKYRSCEDIFEALKPLLKKYELVLQTTDELENIGERYYIKATATLTDVDGSSISNVGYAREEETKKGMDGSQVTGASSSYARKYALNGLFLIDDTKDSDTTNTGEEITEEQAKVFKFTNGKYANKSILEVYDEDKKYLEWWINNKPETDISKMIQLITDIKPVIVTQNMLNLTNEIMLLVQKKGIDLEKIHEHYKHSSLMEYTEEELLDCKERLSK